VYESRHQILSTKRPVDAGASEVRCQVIRTHTNLDVIWGMSVYYCLIFDLRDCRQRLLDLRQLLSRYVIGEHFADAVGKARAECREQRSR